MYRHLNAQRITDTVSRLSDRIAERFPESGLRMVSRELLEIASESDRRIGQIQRPHWLLRIGVGLLILAILAIAAGAVLAISRMVALQFNGIAELLQGFEAGVNEILLLTIALVFFVSMEGRLKRRQALRALHELRSIAHVIDMHQLTKDPEAVLGPMPLTASSPQRTMSRFELSRYLDYCSELLSLVSKLAALYAQYLRDPVVLDAVNDVETLADGLSHKIWQKLMILDTDAGREVVRPAVEKPLS